MSSKPIPSIDDLPDLATPAEVATVLRCSKSYVQSECQKGRIASSLVAGRFLISPQAVRDYLEACTFEPPQPRSTPLRNTPLNVSDDALNEARIRRAKKAADNLKRLGKAKKAAK